METKVVSFYFSAYVSSSYPTYEEWKRCNSNVFNFNG